MTPSTVYLRTPIPFIRGSNRNPNHRAPNHQLTISWLKWSHLFAQPTGIFIPLRPCWRLELQAVGPCARCQARPGVVRGQRWPVGLCRREGAVVFPDGFWAFRLEETEPFFGIDVSWWLSGCGLWSWKLSFLFMRGSGKKHAHLSIFLVWLHDMDMMIWFK